MIVQPRSVSRFMFIFGAIADGAVAVTWFLIATGYELPNVLNGYVGTGRDYQLAMYLGALLMAGWALVLAWGAVSPLARRGLLLITALLLILSVAIELTFFVTCYRVPHSFSGLAGAPCSV